MKVIVIDQNKVKLTLKKMDQQLSEFIKEVDINAGEKGEEYNLMEYIIKELGITDENPGVTSYCYESEDKTYQLMHADHRYNQFTDEELEKNLNIIGTQLIYRGKFEDCSEVHGKAVFLASSFNGNNPIGTDVSIEELKNILLKRIQFSCIELVPEKEPKEIKFISNFPISPKSILVDNNLFGYNLAFYVEPTPDDNRFNQIASYFFGNPVYGRVVILNLLSPTLPGYLTLDEFNKLLHCVRRIKYEELTKYGKENNPKYFNFRYNTKQVYNRVKDFEEIKHELKPPKINDYAMAKLLDFQNKQKKQENSQTTN